MRPFKKKKKQQNILLSYSVKLASLLNVLGLFFPKSKPLYHYHSIPPQAKVVFSSPTVINTGLYFILHLHLLYTMVISAVSLSIAESATC